MQAYSDEYVSRWFDFREDPEEFRTHLAAQSAGGGGDFPEPPEAAFEAMNQLGWRSGDATARLAFWVADAPHHAEQSSRMKSAIEAAESQGVHKEPSIPCYFVTKLDAAILRFRKYRARGHLNSLARTLLQGRCVSSSFQLRYPSGVSARVS